MAGPPAVAWVIRSTRTHRGVLASAMLCGALAAGLYGYSQPWGLSFLLILASLVASWAVALAALRRAHTGTLQWDGVQWLWADGAAGAVRQLDCAMDFQRWMLLRLRLETGALLWLWAESDGLDPRWWAFRRAVVFGSGAHRKSPPSVTGG